MMLNMQFDRRVIIATDAQPWQPSPVSGVWRKPLAREDAERGHATSIVRYDPGSAFPRHEHPLGEEILVLDGVFSDEQGDFAPGSYFRNPPGSGHAPFSRNGCVLLVKLHQFRPHDAAKVCVDTARAVWPPEENGLRVLPLHAFESEKVSLVQWAAGSHGRPHDHPGGEEIFVLSGELIDEHGRYPRGTWLRNPPRSAHCAHVEQQTLVWTKSGHLSTDVHAAAGVAQ